MGPLFVSINVYHSSEHSENAVDELKTDSTGDNIYSIWDLEVVCMRELCRVWHHLLVNYSGGIWYCLNMQVTTNRTCDKICCSISENVLVTSAVFRAMVEAISLKDWKADVNKTNKDRYWLKLFCVESDPTGYPFFVRILFKGKKVACVNPEWRWCWSLWEKHSYTESQFTFKADSKAEFTLCRIFASHTSCLFA